MSDVGHNVGLEPILQPITSERLHHSTANTEDGGRVDIKALGFSEDDNVHFLCAHTYHSLPPSTCYRRHEQEKKGAYDQRFREVERGCFLPLVLSASGGEPTAKMAHKKLASVVATKHNQSYSQQLTNTSAGLASPYFAPQLCA